MPPNPRDIPVFILCGGLGTRLREMTELRPKPMLPVGERPILWHIMNHYARFGFRRFVLCMGYKSEVIRGYFLHFRAMNTDVTVNLATGEATLYGHEPPLDWEVTLADTGELTMTGGRIARAAARYLGPAEHFAVTYGDGLTDADLAAQLSHHLSHGLTGTVLGINPPSRFGEFRMEGGELTAFVEKPELHDAWINGGYFFFRRAFLSRLSPAADCVLEQEALSGLARDGALSVYQHRGYWACMDTQRDWESINKVWAGGQAPWRWPR